jgi:hypothetical protein
MQKWVYHYLIPIGGFLKQWQCSLALKYYSLRFDFFETDALHGEWGYNANLKRYLRWHMPILGD